MSYACFRTSYKLYTTRPPANCPAARIAWDCLTLNGARELTSMRLLDGQWMGQIKGGELEVICTKCQCPGERWVSTGEVDWPTT